jgi:hypothetical protein
VNAIYIYIYLHTDIYISCIVIVYEGPSEITGKYKIKKILRKEYTTKGKGKLLLSNCMNTQLELTTIHYRILFINISKMFEIKRCHLHTSATDRDNNDIPCHNHKTKLIIMVLSN